MNRTAQARTTGTLALTGWLLRPRHMAALVLGVFGIPIVLLAIVVVLLAYGADEPRSLGDTLAALWAELIEDPGQRLMLWVAAALIPVGAVLFAVQRRAYLRVTGAGLEGFIPRVLGFGLFRQTTGRWSLRWDDVCGIRLSVPGGGALNAVQRLGVTRLVIETPRGETWLHPFLWVDPHGPDHRLGIGALLKPGKLDAARRIEAAPLMRAVRERGLPIERGAPETVPVASGFDLARHKGMLVQLVLLFGAGLYALADTFLLAAYEPLGALPLAPFATTGVVGLFAVSRLGRGAPRTERLIVGALTVIALVAAVHPATLRVNAWTAEPETVAYVSAGAGRFDPPGGGLPGIDLSALDVPEYWAEYPPGTPHEFTLLRGVGGFYALALAPVYARTRHFYGGAD